MALQTKFKPIPWPSPEELAANEIKMRDEARLNVRKFEERFRMTSTEMRIRLDAGEIEEDETVCAWLMELYTLALIDSARDY